MWTSNTWTYTYIRILCMFRVTNITSTFTYQVIAPKRKEETSFSFFSSAFLLNILIFQIPGQGIPFVCLIPVLPCSPKRQTSISLNHANSGIFWFIRIHILTDFNLVYCAAFVKSDSLSGFVCFSVLTIYIFYGRIFAYYKFLTFFILKILVKIF